MKRFHVTCCCCMLLLSLVVYALLPGSQASAASGLVTQGDVEAILHGYPSTGCVPLFQVHPVPGFEDCTRAAIFPFSVVSGRHYCVDDWHIVRLLEYTYVDNVYIFTKQQAINELVGTTVTLTLDGVILPLTRTPITMLNAADQRRLGYPGPTFAFLTGSILSPTDLSVGVHTAGTVVTDPVFPPPYEDSTTFMVDPSGAGACLQPLH